MCLVLISYKSHPQYSLVIAGNRDEFYDRPTDPLSFWDDAPDLLGGRDRAKVNGTSGTWMGMTRSGRFSVLTNVRAPNENSRSLRTRGELPVHFLTGTDSPHAFVAEKSKYFNQYNGFNLLMADFSDPVNGGLHWVSNRLILGEQIRPCKVFRPQAISPGVYGLSNAMLDTPWPKVNRSIAAFAQALAMDTGQFKQKGNYLKLLNDSTMADDHELPNTGLSQDWERTLSAPFIQTPSYGTRSSYLLRVHVDGTYHFLERRFNSKGILDEQLVEGQLLNVDHL